MILSSINHQLPALVDSYVFVDSKEMWLGEYRMSASEISVGRGGKAIEVFSFMPF